MALPPIYKYISKIREALNDLEECQPKGKEKLSSGFYIGLGELNSKVNDLVRRTRNIKP